MSLSGAKLIGGNGTSMSTLFKKTVGLNLGAMFALLGFAVLQTPSSYAESPACLCTFDSLEVSITPELGCLTIQSNTAEVCSGSHTQISMTNGCGETVTFRDTRNLTDGDSEQSIEAGEEGHWNEVFDRPIMPGTSGEVRVTRMVNAGSAEYQATIVGQVRCLDNTQPTRTQSDGCSATPDSHTGGPFAFALLLLLWVGGHRSARR